MSPNHQTATAEGRGNPALVPKLRFLEFRGAEAWPAAKLVELCDLNKGEQLAASDKDAGGRYPHYNGGISPSSHTGRANREANTIIISEGGNSCGYVQFITESFWSGGHNYSLAVKAKVNTLCLFYALQAKQREIMALRIGSGLPNIQKTTLGQFGVFLPKQSAEQQKIAECLSSVDELLAAQARKVDALKTHKKGLMQQLFPREGETQPRLRFPEFQNAREWAVKRVDEQGSVLAGKALAVDAPGPQRPYLRTKNVLDGAIDISDVLTMPMSDAEFTRFEILDGDVLLNEGQSLELVGRASIYHGELCQRCAMQNALLRFRAFPSTSAEFASQYFRQCQKDGTFSNLATKTTSVAHLGSSRFSALELAWPSLPEQQRIASCLSSLDALITAETQKHETLKTHKRGLMQQLFPSPEEATP